MADRQLYGFTLHPEPDASPELVQLIRALAHCRVEDAFAAEDFQRFRDRLSAIGVQLLEIETWTESGREVVL